MLAAVFLFSGFVKAVDPMGMSYKIEAYFSLFNLQFLLHNALPISEAVAIALAACEFLLGVYLLFGMHRRFTAWCVVVVMSFMTVLTGYSYLYSTVPDCGCFGDAIVLSNRDSFLKNVLLLLCTFCLLIRTKSIKRIITERTQWIVALYSLIYILILSFYSLYHLPVLDFTPYKVGVNLKNATDVEYETILTYEKNGRTQDYVSTQLPNAPGKFISAQTNKIKAPLIDNFSIYDNQTDITEEVLNDSSFTFLLVSPNLDTSDTGCSDLINDIYDYCEDHRYAFFCLTSSDSTAISKWIDYTGAAYSFKGMDEENIKAMIHSNPGILLLKDGVLIGKWGHNDFHDLAYLCNSAKGGLNVEVRSDKIEYNVYARLVKIIFWFITPLLLVMGVDRIWNSYKYYINQHRLISNKDEKKNCSR